MPPKFKLGLATCYKELFKVWRYLRVEYFTLFLIQGVQLIVTQKYFVTAILIVMILIFPSYHVVRESWTFDMTEKLGLPAHSQRDK